MDPTLLHISQRRGKQTDTVERTAGEDRHLHDLDLLRAYTDDIDEGESRSAFPVFPDAVGNLTRA